MSAQQNKATIGKVNDAFRQNNTEAFLAACTENVIWTMVGDSTVKGKDADSQVDGLDARRGAEVHHHADRCGRRLRDVHRRDDDEGQGRRVGPYSFCDVYRFEGDKIAELNAFVVKRKTAEV